MSKLLDHVRDFTSLHEGTLILLGVKIYVALPWLVIDHGILPQQPNRKRVELAVMAYRYRYIQLAKGFYVRETSMDAIDWYNCLQQIGRT